MHFATEFWLSRLCFQRALGGIYLIAFLIAANQFIPLLGARGLQPVRLFVRHVPFRRAPSLFYINCSDRFITATIWCGIGLSCFAVTGFSESFGLGVSMHSNSHLGISLAAMVHLAAATPNLTYACDTHWPWKTEEIVKPGALEFVDGSVPVPTTPGLGQTPPRGPVAARRARGRPG